MDKLNENKIDETKENLFIKSNKNFNDTDENVEKLDNKFRNMTFENLKKKLIYKYPIKISENIDFLSIDTSTPQIMLFFIPFIASLPICGFLSNIIDLLKICKSIFKSLEHTSDFLLIYLGFLFLCSLFISLGIFLLLKKINFGYFETKFTKNKLQICKGNKITEKILSQNTRFFVKEYTGQIFFYDKETEIEIPLFALKENYAANYLAYKMNKYILNKLHN